MPWCGAEPILGIAFALSYDNRVVPVTATGDLARPSMAWDLKTWQLCYTFARREHQTKAQDLLRTVHMLFKGEELSDRHVTAEETAGRWEFLFNTQMELELMIALEVFAGEAPALVQNMFDVKRLKQLRLLHPALFGRAKAAAKAAPVPVSAGDRLPLSPANPVQPPGPNNARNRHLRAERKARREKLLKEAQPPKK